MRFIRLISFVVIGVWSAVRAAEGAFAVWVKRSVRIHDLAGLAPA